MNTHTRHASGLLAVLLIIVLIVIVNVSRADSRIPTADLALTQLVHANPERGEWFGHRLARSGSTLVVGGRDVAWVYEYSAETWVEQQRLTPAPNPDLDVDEFSDAVAIDGDTIVIGGYKTDVNGVTYQGAAWVYERGDNGVWTETALLTENLGASPRIGRSIAIEGDLIVLGADDADVPGTNGGGKALFYARQPDGSWDLIQTVWDSYASLNDGFGTTATIDDGVVVIGSPRADVTDTYSGDGAVFVYHETTPGSGVWEEVKKLTASDAHGNASFGNAVAIDGDQIVIGATGSDDGELFTAGRAYVFGRNQGGTDNWGEVAILNPEQSVALGIFGRSVDIVQDTIAVGHQGKRQVERFGRNQGGADNWGRLDLTVMDPLNSDHIFGFSVSLYGDDLLVGAPNYDFGTGAVYWVETLPPPEPPVPWAYLPVVVNDFGYTPVFGTLTNGGRVEHPGGLIIGAPADSLPNPVELTLVERSGPPSPLPDGSTLLSPYIIVRADEVVSFSAENPLIMSVPVPVGADTEHLALAVYDAGRTLLDGASGARAWMLLDGVYDSAENRFLTTTAFLDIFDRNFALVEHAGVHSPQNNPVGRTPELVNSTTIIVECWGQLTADLDACENLKLEFETHLSSVNDAYQNNFQFDPPAVRKSVDSINMGDNTIIFNWDTAYIEPPTSSGCAVTEGSYAGYYAPTDQRLVICFDPNAAPTDFHFRTLTHELFHAVEFAYDDVLSDWKNGQSEDWITEGAASASEESWDQSDLKRSPDFPDLRYVDVAFFEDCCIYELQPYHAQDFWVFVGQKYDFDLHYLAGIFDNGADPSAVDSGMPASAPLREAYWEWVKNQTFEKAIDFDGYLTDECVYQEDAVENLEVYEYPEHNNGQTYPVGHLAPLHSQVIEVEFGFQVNGSAGVTETMNSGDDDTYLRVKLYENEDPFCDFRGDLIGDDPGSGFDPTVFETEPDGRYFIVVSNTHHTDPIDFEIFIEGGSHPGPDP